MAYKRIKDPDHGMLLRQLELLAGKTGVNAGELGNELRLLYGEFHELEQSLNRVSKDYQKVAFKVRKMAQKYISAEIE